MERISCRSFTSIRVTLVAIFSVTQQLYQVNWWLGILLLK